ncbi:MAG: segregation/condensation protein A [Clostridia bacterium]|nr:segregation/condensation protein A [Clostridia bacterium]
MEAYNLKLENFEGPLDLLCHLIEKNKMNIYDISIAAITDQYLEYINSINEPDLEITGDFLVMATNLLYLKSKELLPVPKEEEEEDPKEELIRKLIEYKKLKELALEIQQNTEEFSKLYYKEPEDIEIKKEMKLNTEYPKELLPSIFMKIAKINMEKLNHNAEDINKIMERDKVTVRSKIKEILKNLLNKKKIIFNKLFNTKERTKNEVITAFLAMLELNRANKIKIRQKYTFSDIEIERIRN